VLFSSTVAVACLTVLFWGGEPTLQAALPDAMRTARALRFRIGLHTAGPYPKRLAAALPLIDWIGLDIKAPFEDYERVGGEPANASKQETVYDVSSLAALPLAAMSATDCIGPSVKTRNVH
jgi:pyruvate-formate lyase-activating enzyme